MLTTGVDLIEVARVGAAIARHGARFLDRVYTPAEQAHCGGRLPALAGRFAAKEAVAKALGTGIGQVWWREIEVLPDPQGRPVVHLAGRALARCRALGVEELALSLSHTREHALAFVVGR